MPPRKIIRRTRPKFDRHEEPVEEPEVKSEKHIHIGPNRSAVVQRGVPCVYVEKGVTKNLGDFNSARITYGILLPLDYTPDDLKKVSKVLRVADDIILKNIEDDVEDLELDED